MNTPWKAPADYGLGWLYEHQPGPPECAARVAAQREAARARRAATLSHMTTSTSPLLRDMAAALSGQKSETER